ncbi:MULTISPECIES: hypothetical protein [Streptomyces]|uniref:Uncharacterized protein n=2 Tax=Streptomyces TaxID=1883 RepID=A0AB39NYI3_9ACTN|nr:MULTISPECIES: hypothetical protein [Streptomyces]GGQ08496.1 hypothetical protein GCM10010233_26620 [Streptomyces gancidicus]GGS58595.1 hypothetical protein GCM10010285_42500 [Streptomyces rubiginosus]
MAKGRNCQVCRQRMSVRSEQRQPMGSWVVHECHNPACRNWIDSGRRHRFSEKVFEDK